MSFTGNMLIITPAPLTVTANPQTKVYGTSDPPLTDTVTGLVDTTLDSVTIDDTAASVLTGTLARARRAPWPASRQAATRLPGERWPPIAITRSLSRAAR